MGKLETLLGGQEAGQLQRPEGRKSWRVQEESTGTVDDKVFRVSVISSKIEFPGESKAV